MRPDEHKRKKNEQYKKKHGMKSASNKTPGTSSKAPEHVKKSGPVRSAPPVVPERNDAKEEETTTVYKPNFQRRKVESNWDRYSETPSSQHEDEKQLVGADFKELLASSSTGFSQFRFKDEQEWDEEQTESDSSSACAWLSLDCKQLSGVVNSVPLHERLLIDETHFQEAQLEKFKANAVKCRENYQTKKITDPVQHIENTSESINRTEQKANDTVYKEDSQDNRNKNMVDENITNDNSFVKDNSDPDELDDILGIDGKSEKQINTEHDDITAHPDKEIKTNSDQLPQTMQNTVENNTQTGEDSFVNKEIEVKHEHLHLEDDLDALLCLDDSPRDKLKGDAKNSEQTLPTSQNQVAAENLEEWLDSVLDD